MRRFLLFDLHGVLASWGRVTRGSHRMSWRRPSKSAVLGLVGAALGIRRREEDRLDALFEGLGFAVRVDAAGTPLVDYQTAESRSGKSPRDVPTRRDTLRQFDEKEPQIKHKEYLCDHAACAALWRVGEAAPDLERMADGLNQPDFTTYLGRKSCPPTAPFRPRVVDAADVGAALLEQSGERPAWWPEPDYVRLYWESSWDPDEAEVTTHQMHDDAEGGPLRTFSGRDEKHATFEWEH